MWLPLPLHPKMDPRRDELPPKLDITYIDTNTHIYIYILTISCLNLSKCDGNLWKLLCGYGVIQGDRRSSLMIDPWYFFRGCSYVSRQIGNSPKRQQR